jgi:hypothetical protein
MPFRPGGYLKEAVFKKPFLLVMWCLLWFASGCSNDTDGTLTILYTSDTLGNIEFCG